MIYVRYVCNGNLSILTISISDVGIEFKTPDVGVINKLIECIEIDLKCFCT